MATFEKRATTILDETVNVTLTYRELFYLYASASEVSFDDAACVYRPATGEAYDEGAQLVLTDEIGEFLSEFEPYFIGGNA